MNIRDFKELKKTISYRMGAFKCSRCGREEHIPSPSIKELESMGIESSLNMIKVATSFCDLFKVGLMSGKIYNVFEAKSFVEALMKMKNNKFYLKESLRKLTGYSNEDSDNFVGPDYSLFK